MNLPHDFAADGAEASILAQLLTDQPTLAIWINELSEDHFRNMQHRAIFQKIKEHYAEHGTADISAFGNSDLAIDAVGLLEYAQTGAKTEYYFAQLECARRVRSVASMIAAWTDYENSESINELTTKLLSLSLQTKDFPEYSIKNLAERAIERWEKKIIKRKNFHLGIPVVDDHLRLRAGNMVYVVAPAKTGKTWLEVSIANFLSIGNKVFFISAEMHPDDIYTRLASKISECDLTPLDYLDDLHRGKILKWGEKAGEIMERQLTVVKARGMSFATLKGRILSAIQRGYDIIMLDYLQRITAPGPDQRTITLEMSRDLSNMAGRYEKLFIVASQASRAAQNAKFTQAHHAMESSAIEQDADAVLSLTAKGDHALGQDHRLIVDIFQRNGTSGQAYLRFDPRTGAYSEDEKW